MGTLRPSAVVPGIDFGDRGLQSELPALSDSQYLGGDISWPCAGRGGIHSPCVLFSALCGLLSPVWRMNMNVFATW